MMHALLLALAIDSLSRFEFVEPQMGTLFRIVVYAPTKAEAQSGADAAFARVAYLNSVFSDYDSTSEVRRLATHPAGSPVVVSAELLALLTHAQRVAAASGGAFDVTIGPAVGLWRRSRHSHVLPTSDERRMALRGVGYTHIALDSARHTVTLTAPGMQLDFGGIAKGAAADAALAELRRRGLRRALVAAGGDLAIGDAPPDESGWAIAVPGIASERRLVHCGVSTSGDANQFVEIGGVRYSHIINPRTGLGITDRRQVTVIAPTATESDVLSTAIYVLGEECGRALLARRTDVDVLMSIGAESTRSNGSRFEQTNPKEVARP